MAANSIVAANRSDSCAASF